MQLSASPLRPSLSFVYLCLSCPPRQGEGKIAVISLSVLGLLTSVHGYLSSQSFRKVKSGYDPWTELLPIGHTIEVFRFLARTTHSRSHLGRLTNVLESNVTFGLKC
jgi:hypothetical protein